MNIPIQEWGYYFFELQCHTTSMALEHIWAIITHIVHNIPSISLNFSPSSSIKHLNIRTKIVVKCGKNTNLVNIKEDMLRPTLDHIHVDRKPLGIIN
jgi:hypothetical protein